MLELAKAARKYPHPEVEWIFTHDPEAQSSSKKDLAPKSKIQRLTYHLDYFRWKEFQLPDLVKKYNPDVLLCPDFVSPAASLPCKRLTVIHDAFFWQMPENYPRWWRTYFLRLLKKGLKENTRLITTTNYAEQSLRPFLGNRWPISVIYQAPKGMHGAADTQFLTQHDLDHLDYFLHVGTFDRRKNLPQLVLAYSEYLKRSKSPKKLVLAGGPGQSQQMNDFPIVKDLIASLGLHDRVLLPGYLSDGAIKALYEGGFAYIFPSKNEGFGIPILEAMHAGLPVIHSNQPALVEVAGRAGMPFEIDSIPDLTEKMILLEEENGLSARLIQHGKERAEAFSAKKFIDDFHQLILSA